MADLLDQPVWVVSPHLDDAVLSCGRLLAALGSSVVFTVFGGSPPGPQLASHEWDLGTTGHEAATDAVSVRQDEDRRATALVGARPEWTAWSQYHDPQPDDDDLVVALTPLTAGNDAPRSVLVPLGIMHPDHVAVSNATLRLLLEHDGGHATYYAYAEVPYATAYPSMVAERLEHWRRRVSLREVRLPQAPVERRIEAVDAYATQMPMLRVLLPHVDDDVRAAERYWRIGPFAAD